MGRFRSYLSDNNLIWNVIYEEDNYGAAVWFEVYEYKNSKCKEHMIKSLKQGLKNAVQNASK